jgi:hypothetical protein
MCGIFGAVLGTWSSLFRSNFDEVARLFRVSAKGSGSQSTGSGGSFVT